MVKSAKLDRYFKDVYEINENYWYQLQVDPATLTKKDGTNPSGEYVLTVERDYSTGKLYLTARSSTNAVLTHSLWKIKANGRDVNGRTYTFVNKETGFELTYDHYNALTRKGRNSIENPPETPGNVKALIMVGILKMTVCRMAVILHGIYIPILRIKLHSHILHCILIFMRVTL